MDEKNQKNEIVSLIKEDLDKINKLSKEIDECKGEGFIIKRAKGSILHDFYNACERIFELIANNLNGGTAGGHRWHKRLLYKMTVNIENVRTPVISRELAAELDEYLAFRHLFRNIYGFELESNRLDDLVERFPEVAELFQKEINSFIEEL
jgi:hypothetical protein